MTDASQPSAQFATQALSIIVRPPAVPSVFVANGGSGNVTDYALSATGNTPSRVTIGRGNGLLAPSGVAVDATGRLFVVNAGSNSISEFAPYATSSLQA